MNEELEWVEVLVSDFNLSTIVEVTFKGSYYPTYVDMMAELGLTGAKEFKNKFGTYWNEFIREEYPSNLENFNMSNDEKFLLHNGVNVCRPSNGDICYLINKEVEHPSFNEKIYRLIRINDGREFIMSRYGFEIKK